MRHYVPMLMWNKSSQEVAGKSQREPGEGLSAQPADKLRDVQSERSILKTKKIGKKLTMRNRISTCSLTQGILKELQITKPKPFAILYFWHAK
ncbi:hypothetical protein [Escherichia albertii]|uniref:hypothetical protein n=1 Tax=Escherichia albertii TaxID=208962 RepID=UPI0013DE4F75|nr:hypothetical protein [Escherichia albertii]